MRVGRRRTWAGVNPALIFACYASALPSDHHAIIEARRPPNPPGLLNQPTSVYVRESDPQGGWPAAPESRKSRSGYLARTARLIHITSIAQLTEPA
jgi:hypothetical protein